MISFLRCFEIARPSAAVSKNATGSNHRELFVVFGIMLRSLILKSLPADDLSIIAAVHLYKIAHFWLETLPAEPHPFSSIRPSCASLRYHARRVSARIPSGNQRNDSLLLKTRNVGVQMLYMKNEIH
jgi:hypothetical protein